MRLARHLLLAGLATVACAVVLLIALFTLDLGRFSPPLLRWTSAAIGRDVAIDGAVSLRMGRIVRLTARDVRLANSPWGSRPDMASAARLTVEVDAWSLLRRPVIVTRIEVDGLDVLLERRADGSSNWELRPDASPERFTWPESFPVVVDRVSLPGARLRFSGPRLARPLDLRFDSLVQRRTGNGMLELAGQGFANDEVLRLDLKAGPFARLVAGRDFGGTLAAQVGALLVDAKLHVDDLGRPVDTELDFRLRGPGAGCATWERVRSPWTVCCGPQPTARGSRGGSTRQSASSASRRAATWPSRRPWAGSAEASTFPVRI